MVVKIVEAGADVLRQKADHVPSRLMGSQALQDLVAIMKAAVQDAPGVGLAAPQIGMPLRVIVFGDAERNARYLTERERAERGRTEIELQAWINPSLRPLSDATVEFLEGCLSVPGFQAKVKRFVDIELSGFDENGEPEEPLKLSGWPARIVQHEIDHLDGVLYVDRMDSRTFSTRDSLARDGLSETLKLLGL
jgi:peptide deformylase